MAFRMYLLFILVATVHGAPDKLLLKAVSETEQLQENEKQDLKTASSSYSHQYSDWRGRYPGGYEVSVTGYGTVDDRSASNFADVGGYNNVGYGGNPGFSASPGFNANPSYSSSPGLSASPGIIANPGYGGTPISASPGYSSYGGYKGYDGLGQSGYDGRTNSYSGYNNYAGNRGYGLANSGNGGYGGYGGNGGLTSYYGYNNPYYQENNHLGYGYYKRPGYGSIYNSGITPSLVTGYRGYSR